MDLRTTALAALLLALALVSAATAQEVEIPTAGDDDDSAAVDAEPYAAALVAKFQECLADEAAAAAQPEGSTAAATPAPPTPAPAPELDAPDALPVLDVQEELENAMESFALLLGRNRPEGSCTANDAAVLACAADVATWSCETLSHHLESAMTGGLGGADSPPWAKSYAQAMGGKVEQCFTEEVGAPPTPEQLADLDTYENILAGAMGSMGSACLLNQERFSECLAGIPQISCDALAAQISSDASITATAFVSSCEGFLDCGF